MQLQRYPSVELKNQQEDMNVDKDKEIIQIDHTPLNVHIVGSKSDSQRTEPELTILTDAHTRTIVGFNVTLPGQGDSKT